jgi:uncharacterized protein YtpQ (UPF0354 family)
MTPEELTGKFVDRLVEQLAGAQANVVEPLVVDVTLEDGSELSCSLHNAWAKHEGGEEADVVLDAFIQAIREAIEAQSTPPGTDCIVPTVRSIEYIDAIAETAGAHPVSEPLVADLWVVYAFDRPGYTQPVMPADRERLEISDDEIRRAAHENLPGHVEEPELHWFDAGGMITAGGDHEASLLLVDGLWEALAEEVPGDIIACAPARDTLLLTGTDIDRGVARMLDTAITVLANGDHVISDTLLRRTADGWELFPAEEERALINEIHEAIALLVEGDPSGSDKLGAVRDPELAAELVYDVAEDADDEDEDAAMVARLCKAALELEFDEAELREALEALAARATS